MTQLSTSEGNAPSANQYQVGGDHYRKREYQHWDFVADAGLGYFTGQATKYLARWRDKAGVADLEKALHYLRKRRELLKPDQRRRARSPDQIKALLRFADQYAADTATRSALIAAASWVYRDDLNSTISVVEALLKSAEAS